MASEKISVYSIPDLKTTSDETIPVYLNSLKFKQMHTLVDVQIGLGSAAVITAAACFMWDYKLGFEATKTWTTIAVVIYGILCGLGYIWDFFAVKETVYKGIAPNGAILSIATKTSKHSPIYKITANVVDSSKKTRKLEFEAPFANWFDESGRLVALLFQQMLATNIALVGTIDPEKVVDFHKQLSGMTPSELDVLLATSTGIAIGSSTATEAINGMAKRK